MAKTTIQALPWDTSDGPETAHVYGEIYFQGNKSESNYDDYMAQALGPSRMLAEVLFHRFQPVRSLDVGCAVGHTVKRLHEYGVSAYGIDISDWAVTKAGVDYVTQLDFSREMIPGSYDLVFSYDVVEHVPLERLKYAIENLWQATEKNLLIVPALYPEGTTEDVNEPTHLIFHDYHWWLNFCIQCGCIFDQEITNQLAAEEHSKIFDYSSRIMAFKKE